MARTLYQKIIDAHSVAQRPGGERLLYVDRHYLDETCFTAFDTLERRGRAVRRPDLSFAFADHTVPTRPGHVQLQDPEIRKALERQNDDTRRHGIRFFGLGSPHQGIAHVSAPEQGLTLPGLVIVGSDSHMPTHGGLGALGLGVGLSEQAHVLATQTIWHQPADNARIRISGTLPGATTSKDLVLELIHRIGAAGAVGSVIEFQGDTIREMPVEQRMTLCNMAVEAGARSALVAADEQTLAYLEGRRHAPRGKALEDSRQAWRLLRSDADAAWDLDLSFEAETLAPMVTWGTSPDEAVRIDGRVPSPEDEPREARRMKMRRALDYMGLQSGRPLKGLPIDYAFIGSCTNGRLSDLHLAAAVLRGRKVRVPTLIAPGSEAVRQAAEAEGLDRVFIEAGADWGRPGCSLCVAMNGERVGAGQRCASTTNRNFVGRQGPGSRTHLMGPAMVAAAAVSGCLADAREFL